MQMRSEAVTGWFLFGVSVGILIGAAWVAYAIALELQDALMDAELRAMLAGE